MSIDITQDEMNILNLNGITYDDVKANIDFSRASGLDDETIRQQFTDTINQLQPMTEQSYNETGKIKEWQDKGAITPFEYAQRKSYLFDGTYSNIDNKANLSKVEYVLANSDYNNTVEQRIEKQKQAKLERNQRVNEGTGSFIDRVGAAIDRWGSASLEAQKKTPSLEQQVQQNLTSLENNKDGKIDFSEATAKSFLSGEWTPFIGGYIGGIDDRKQRVIQEKIINNQPIRQDELDFLNARLEAQKEEAVRGYTLGGEIGTSLLPSMIRFSGEIATGTWAIKSLGLMPQLAKGATLGQQALHHGRNILVGGAVNTLLPTSYGDTFENYQNRLLQNGLQFTDKGEVIFQEAKEKPAISFMKSLGETFVMFASEHAGGLLGIPVKGISSAATKYVGTPISQYIKSNPKMVKFIDKVMPELSKLYEKANKLKPQGKNFEFLKDMTKFDGFVEELGEEVVEDVLNLTLGTKDKERSLENYSKAIFKSPDEWAVLSGAIAIQGGLLSVGSHVLGSYMERNGATDEEIINTLNSLSEVEKRQVITQITNDGTLDVSKYVNEELQAKQKYQDSLFKQAKQAGLDDVEANANAELFAESFANLAKQTGMSIEDIQNEANIVIKNLSDQEAIEQYNEDTRKVLQGRVEEVKYQSAASAGANENEVAIAEKEYAEKGTESSYFKKWSNNTPLVKTNEEAMSYEFKSGKGVTVKAHHGTKRKDRIGSVFLPERSTSGPMAFFSSNREVSEGYAKNKEDTSLSNEINSYSDWFKIKINDEEYSLDKAWNKLPLSKRNEITQKAGSITLNWDTEEIIFDENEKRGLGQFDYNIRYKRGNALEALIEEWLNSGTLFGSEEEFLKVLDFLDLDVVFNDPNKVDAGVYDVYITMQKPFVTNDIPAEVLETLENEAKKQPMPRGGFGADPWDKNTKDPIWWINTLKEDYANGENSHVWTSIPDWVTNVLKQYGYDGIIDIGGKSGGEIHKVYIPFTSEQIKSVDNRGTFDANNPNIYYQAMIAGINPKQKVNVIDLSKQIANIPDKKALLNFLQTLVGKTKIKTSDKKAVLNFVKDTYRINKKGKGKKIDVSRHIVFSSITNSDKERNIVINNIVDLIEQSVMIEVEPNKKKSEKPFVDEYYRFYVPVRIGQKIFTIRIVAENQKKNNLFNIVRPSVYDVIIDKKEVAPKVNNAPVLSKPLNSNIPQNKKKISNEQITIEEMLKGVQSSDGKVYFQSIDNIKQNFDYSAQELEEMFKADVLNILQENMIDETEFNFEDIRLYGSYSTNRNKQGSDLDFLVQYSGEMREDDAFNLLNEQDLTITDVNGNEVKVDFNPIRTDVTGTIDEYLKNNSKIYFQSAYHGTPHRFDEFALDHIGTGEGHQAHGWGLYFAGNKNISEKYRRILSKHLINIYYDNELLENDTVDYERLEKIITYANNNRLTLEEARKILVDEAQDSYNKIDDEILNDYLLYEIKELSTFDLSKVEYDNKVGQVFEVDIPENDVLLDEDKIISEQPKIVKKAFEFEQNELIKKLSAYQLTFKGITNFENINIQEVYGTKYWNEAFEKFKNNPKKYIDKYYSASKITGKKLYDDIVHRLGSPKKASKKLNELGIKGITYDGKQDGRCYVIFDDKAINVIKTYYQSIEDDSNLNDTERGIINSRGFTYQRENFDGSPKENMIVLLKHKANASTLVHEFAHVYLQTLNNLARNNVKAKELLLTVNKWLRYDGREYTTAQHEKFANGFVAFVKSGKAPSYGLKRVFENFRRWLGDIWNSVSQSDEVEIDEETRKVFNTLLGDISVGVQDEQIEKLLDDAKQNAALRLLNENIENGDVKFNELTDTQRRYRDTAYSIIYTALKNSKDEETRNYVQSIADLRMKLGSGSTKSLKKQKERIEFLLSELDDPFSANDGFLPEWGEFFTDTGVSYDNQEVGADAELALEAFDVIVNKRYLYAENNFGELSQEEVKRYEYEYEYILNEYKKSNDKSIPMMAFYTWHMYVHDYLQEEFYKKWENETNEIDRYNNLSKFEQAKEDLKLKAAKMQGMGDYSQQFAEYAREIIKRLDFMTERDKARIFDKLKDFNSFREVQANLDDVMDFAETLYNVTERRKIADDIIREVKQTIHEWKDGIKRTKYTYPANKLFERLRELNKLPQEDIQDIYDAQVNEEIKPTYEADKVNTDDYYETIEKMFIEFKANGVYYNSSEFLQNLLTRIQDAKFTAKIARDEIDFERRMQSINLIDECARAVGKHKNKTSKLEKAYRFGFNLNSALEMMFDKNIKNKFSLDYLYAQKDAKVGADRDDVLKRLKDVFGFRGPVSDILLFNQFINMTKKEFKIKQRYTPDIAQGVIRQTHRDKETGKQFIDRTIEYSSGVIRSEWEAEEIQLSRMELLYYYILSKNEQSYQILTDMGTDTQAPKGQFDKNDFDELLENLTPQEKMMGDVLQLAAERYYPELNKYHIEKYHTELGKSKNYFPRKTELTEVKPLELFNDYVQYSGVISAQKQRTAGLGSRIAPANALAVLFNHIEKANTLIIMGKQLDLMNSVFKEQNLKKKIEAVWGIETTKEFYNHIAGNLYSGQASILSEAESLIGTIENNVIKAQIFAKAQVGLKQIISFMNYGTGDEYVSTSEWSKAFAKQTFSPKEWKKNIDYMLSIPYLKDRFGRGGSTDALKRQLEQRMFAKISLLDDFLSVNIRVGDMVAIVMGGKPYIDVLMEKGYTEEQAQKLFIEKTVNEMQSSIPSTLSNIQRNAAKQPLAKMLFAYQNTPWQYFRVAANSIIQFKQNPSKYTGLNMVKLVGLYMYVFPLIFNLASSLSIVTGDEDELYMDIWKSLIGGITFVPLAGMFVNSILSGFLGERSSTGNWFDTAAAKTGNVARKIAKGDDLTFVDLLKAVALFGEASTGIPLITLGTEVSGAKDIVTGEPVKGAMKVAGYSDYRAKKVSGEK